MIAAMDRVEIVFLRSELSKMIPFLQEQGVVQLESVPLALENHPNYLQRVHLPEAEEKELDELQSLGTLLKEALPLLTARPRHGEIVEAGRALTETGDATLAQWRRTIQGRHRDLRSLNRRKLNIQDNIEALRNYAAMLEALTPLLAERGAVLGETARAMVLDGYGPDDLEELEQRLVGQVGIECSLRHQRLGRAATSLGLGRNCVIAVVTHPAHKAESVGTFLRDEGITAVRAPDEEVHGTSIGQAVERIEGKLAALQSDLEGILEELAAYSAAHGAEMAALEQILEHRIAQLRAVEQFARSEMVTAAHGWVPCEHYEGLAAAVEKNFGDRAAIQRLKGEDVDIRRIPTLLRNPDFIRPFERILGLLKPPTYGTYDPTLVVGLSFVIFYGFVLGDAGYGLVIIALAAWVKSKWGHILALRDVMTIAQWMGVSSIVFGLIYLEIFGNLVEKLTGWPVLFHRAHEVTVLLGLAIVFGAVHVPLSLLIGAREGYRHGHLGHAREKLAMLLSLIALGLAVASATGALPFDSRAGFGVAGIVFAAALVNFVRGMGPMAPMGLMEIFGLCANILSYSRLMALGVASIAFADIANMLPEMLGGGTTGMIIGIPIALVVHVFNIGLGVFSPTIHSLRLNVVEFMPKFFEGEGSRYEPFRKELAW